MKIGFIMNLRAPYRTLQLNEFSKIDNIQITSYYTNKKKDNRSWNTNLVNGFKEVDLVGVKISKEYGYLNRGILKLISNNDLILIGGYEQPTIILIVLICIMLKKPYVIVFDGITVNRLEDKLYSMKNRLKKLIVDNSAAIFANGTVGRKYFKKVFNYPENKIFNQYLSVDTKKIENLLVKKDLYKKKYREILGIGEEEKVFIYSGRLIEIKNVKLIIEALSKVEYKNITLVILGGGSLENELIKLAKRLNVKIKITGFIENQEELFKHYFIGDLLILASIIEPWGLVINEACAARIPIAVSKECGCSLDIKDKDRIFEDLNDLIKIINKFLIEDAFIHKEKKCELKEFTIENSKKSFEIMLNKIKGKS